jgi:hypothetical protein
MDLLNFTKPKKKLDLFGVGNINDIFDESNFIIASEEAWLDLNNKALTHVVIAKETENNKLMNETLSKYWLEIINYFENLKLASTTFLHHLDAEVSQIFEQRRMFVKKYYNEIRHGLKKLIENETEVEKMYLTYNDEKIGFFKLFKESYKSILKRDLDEKNLIELTKINVILSSGVIDEEYIKKMFSILINVEKIEEYISLLVSEEIIVCEKIIEEIKELKDSGSSTELEELKEKIIKVKKFINFSKCIRIKFLLLYNKLSTHYFEQIKNLVEAVLKQRPSLFEYDEEEKSNNEVINNWKEKLKIIL